MIKEIHLFTRWDAFGNQLYPTHGHASVVAAQSFLPLSGQKHSAMAVVLHTSTISMVVKYRLNAEARMNELQNKLLQLKVAPLMQDGICPHCIPTTAHLR